MLESCTHLFDRDLTPYFWKVCMPSSFCFFFADFVGSTQKIVAGLWPGSFFLQACLVCQHAVALTFDRQLKSELMSTHCLSSDCFFLSWMRRTAVKVRRQACRCRHDHFPTATCGPKRAVHTSLWTLGHVLRGGLGDSLSVRLVSYPAIQSFYDTRGITENPGLTKRFHGPIQMKATQTVECFKKGLKTFRRSYNL